MASWLDIESRLRKLEAGCLYTGEPPRILKQVTTELAQGRIVAINTKGTPADAVIVCIPLAKLEGLLSDSLEPEDHHAEVQGNAG